MKRKNVQALLVGMAVMMSVILPHRPYWQQKTHRQRRSRPFM